MAKKIEDLPKLTLVIPIKQPSDKPKNKQYRTFTPTCGMCGRDAEYEVYDTLQPHCERHMLEAMDSKIKPFVRPLGGFDDAS
ncbi:hypothetical protein MHH28_07915 [Paenibacillus sp. FSL K6-1217]|uniref:hypothetical protein n=1 Tax=Paenibacillus sp. FSL K6-1217 TaxID=2921466 RepID=UPI00325624F3